MFGFIKRLFGGILSFIGGLFGAKGKEYVMEFGESPSQPEAPSQPVVADTPKPVAKPAPKKEAKRSKKQSQAASQPVPDPVPLQTVQAESKPPSNEGFAPTFLNPALQLTPRRRPGANMAPFLTMARGMNT